MVQWHHSFLLNLSNFVFMLQVFILADIYPSPFSEPVVIRQESMSTGGSINIFFYNALHFTFHSDAN